jgi:hypothetical protein
MQSGMTERSFGDVGDQESYYRRSLSGYGRTLAASTLSRPAGLSFGERLIEA